MVGHATLNHHHSAYENSENILNKTEHHCEGTLKSLTMVFRKFVI